MLILPGSLFCSIRAAIFTVSPQTSYANLDIPTKPTHFFTEGRDKKFLSNKREQYDEYIAYVDAEFGRLYEYLDQIGELDNTILILTSDHGEMFERGIENHLTAVMYEPLLRIPLLMWIPGRYRRHDIYTPTSSIDILIC